MNSFIKFCIVGIFSTSINYLIYLYLFSQDASIFLSSAIGYGFGTITSYHFGRIWVFEREYEFKRIDLLKFVIIYSINGYIVALITSNLSEKILLDYRLSWVVAIFYGMISNYFGSRIFIFKKNNEN